MKRHAWVLAGLIYMVLFAPAFGDSDKARMAHVDKMLQQVAQYDWGQNRAGLTAFSDTLRAFHQQAGLLAGAQDRMLALLKSKATPASKQYICQELSLMGDGKAVPVLAAMLKDSAMFDMAMYALERIPAPSVDEAMKDRLPKTSGREKIGLINALGNRAADVAVPALSESLMDLDEDVGLAAAVALGKIGGPVSLAALENIKPMAIGDMQLQIGESMAVCAEKMVKAGDREGALRVYGLLLAQENPLPIRQAALIGSVHADPEASRDLILHTLQEGPDGLRSTAVSLIRNVEDPAVLKPVIERLSDLSPLHQAQLLSAFSDMDVKNLVLPAVLDAVRSGDDAVRIAALKALAALGDASCVIPLAEKAADGSSDEKTAARESLTRLSGAGVDDAILANIGTVRTPMKIELIRCLAPRSMTGGADVLFVALDDKEPRVRIEAYRALAEITGPEHLPRLVDRLADASTDADRREAAKTINAVGMKIADPEKRGDALIDKWESVGSIAAKSAFLEVMGKLGDPDALPLIRKCLADRNPEIQSSAVVALSDWPDDAPMEDLLKIARKSKNESLQTLALRGAIKLTGSSIASPDQALRLYLEAFSLAEGIPEKQAVLSGVAKVASTKALDMAMMNLSNPEIGNEAEAAALQIIRNIREKHPDEAGEAVKKLAAEAKNPSIKEEAEELAKEMEGK